MRRDSIIALLLIAASAWLYTVSQSFPRGAELFPHLLLATIVALSAVVLAMDLRRRRTAVEPAGPPRPGWARPYVAFAMMVLYVIGMQSLGFFVSTVAFAVVFMLYLGVRNLVGYALAISSMVLFYFLLFDRFLHVPLPRGAFF